MEVSHDGVYKLLRSPATTKSAPLYTALFSLVETLTT